jgi:hypothetical protein
MAYMTDPQTADDLVSVSHHMFYIVDTDHLPEPPSVSSNGLVLVQTGAAVILTGIHTGVANLAVEIHREPPDVDTADWDDVVEVSLRATNGRATVAALMSRAPDLPVLTPDGPGDYRLRVHARGRDTAPDGVAFEPFEDYLIAVWPAPFAPERTYKLTDAYGAGQRRAAASMPPPAPTPPKPETAEDRRRRMTENNLLRYGQRRRSQS